MVSEQAAMWWGGWPMGFYCHPSPFGLDFGTLDFGTWDLGLTTVSTSKGGREKEEALNLVKKNSCFLLFNNRWHSLVLKMNSLTF